MADQNGDPIVVDCNQKICELGPLGFVVLLCSEQDALVVMVQRIIAGVSALKAVISKADFSECVDFLVYMDKRFPDEQLAIFQRMCELAEGDEQFSFLEDRVTRLPEEIIGFAMRALEKSKQRLLDPLAEADSGSEVKPADLDGQAEPPQDSGSTSFSA